MKDCFSILNCLSRLLKTLIVIHIIHNISDNVSDWLFSMPEPSTQ